MFEFAVFLLVLLAYVAITVAISERTDRCRKVVTLDQALEHSQRKSKICSSRVVSIASSLGLRQKTGNLDSNTMPEGDVKKSDAA